MSASDETSLSEAGAESPGATAPKEVATVPARFLPMPMPSAPFWLALMAGVTALIIVLVTWSVIFTFAIGAAIAVFCLPIVSWLVNRGWGRSVASIVIVLVIVVVFILAMLGVLAIIINQGLPFVKSIPGMIDDIQAGVADSHLPDWLASTISSVADGIETAINSIDVPTVVIGIFQGVLGFLGTLLGLFVVPFFIFYLLRDEPRVSANFYNGVPAQWRAHVDTITRVFKDDFADYFKAEVIVGSIMFVIISVGILVIGWIVGGPLASFALFLGLFAGVMELLPTIGPIIAMIPALLIALTISPFAFVLVFAFYMIAFQFESAFLVPTIEGKVISFGPATVLLIIAIGFGLGGIVGAILALPVAAIVRDLFAYFFRNAESESLPEGSLPLEVTSG